MGTFLEHQKPDSMPRTGRNQALFDVILNLGIGKYGGNHW